MQQQKFEKRVILEWYKGQVKAHLYHNCGDLQ